MNNKYVSLEEFEKISGVKIQTIKKRASEIPGLELKNNRVLKGTRYPFPIGKYKAKDLLGKRYVLLKAISQNRYVDNISLNLYEEQFEDLISELMNAKLIKKNQLPNHFGANNYDITPQGDEWLSSLKSGRIESNALLSKCIGCIAGEFLSNLST